MSRREFRLSDRVAEILRRRLEGLDIDAGSVEYVAVFHACLDCYELGFSDRSRCLQAGDGQSPPPMFEQFVMPGPPILRIVETASDPDDPDGAA